MPREHSHPGLIRPTQEGGASLPFLFLSKKIFPVSRKGVHLPCHQKLNSMSVYKEIGFLVREINRRSRQVFNDAADYGVPIENYSDPLIARVKGLMEHYEVPVKTERYDTGFTQTFEFDGGWPAVVEAGFEKARIEFVSVSDRLNKKLKGILSVAVSTSPEAQSMAESYDY